MIFIRKTYPQREDPYYDIFYECIDNNLLKIEVYCRYPLDRVPHHQLIISEKLKVIINTKYNQSNQSFIYFVHSDDVIKDCLKIQNRFETVELAAAAAERFLKMHNHSIISDDLEIFT